MRINYFKILLSSFFKVKIIYKKHHINKTPLPKLLKLVVFLKIQKIFLSWYNIKNEPKKSQLLFSNQSYFIVDQYKKDTFFHDEDYYYFYHIDVDRI